MTHSQITTFTYDTHWLSLFDVNEALASVDAHLSALPSSDTEENHTRRQYTRGLWYFLAWASSQDLNAKPSRHAQPNITRLRFPDKNLVRVYVGHLRNRGLKASSISSAYLAPLTHFINGLLDQNVAHIEDAEIPRYMRYKDDLRRAGAIKRPPAEKSTSRAPVDQHGHRLTVNQVDAVLGSCDPNTLIGKRNLAVLYLGFNTGLRIAELARLTPASFQQDTDCYLITVRGKRNNTDPVAIDSTGIQLIQDYIHAYNAALDDQNAPLTDPRRITDECPLWRSLTSGGYIPDKIRANAISKKGIAYMIRSTSSRALGFAIGAHDMRRTYASIARANGFEYDDIQAQLRHKSVATTALYVGKRRDYKRGLLTNRIQFNIPIAS